MGAARNCLIVADDRLSTATLALDGESGVPARRMVETPFPPSLPRRFLLVFTLLLFFFRPVSGEGQERCGVGKDYMVQALEQIKAGSREEVEDGLQLLKHANEQCTSLGDAWCYRSLFERKLGRAPLAVYSLKKAQMFGSDAMEQKSDPFSLAAPAVPGNSPPGLTPRLPRRDVWAYVFTNLDRVGADASAARPSDNSAASAADSSEEMFLWISLESSQFTA